MDSSLFQTSTRRHELSPEARLEELRTQLDSIDKSLLEIVCARIDICAEVALVKDLNSIPVIQPARMEVVQDRAAEFARTHNLSPEFVRSLYELIMGEACRVEDRVIEQAHTVPPRTSSGR